MRSVWMSGLLAAALLGGGAQADPVEDFYKGKTVSVVVGSGPVGTYASYAQLLNEFMSQHIPGKPNMIFQAMPGAGGLTAANHAFNIAPKDGTSLLVVVQTLAVEQALGSKAVRYDASKFNFIGRMVDNTPILVGWTAAGVNAMQVVRSKEAIIGGVGASSPTNIFPKLLNETAGAKFKIISGYKGVDDLMLAMERGETQAMVASIGSFQTVFASALNEKKVSILAQLAIKRHADIQHVPTAGELSMSAEGRAVADFVASGSDIGRSVITTPGTPPDRLEALRRAFVKTMKDPAFLEAAAKRSQPLSLRESADMEQVVANTLNTAPEVIARAREILGVQ